MRKSLLIKLHLYTGIFISFYLVVFGFSSIVLNHNIDLKHSQVKRTWQTNVTVDSSLPDRELAENIRDELGIMGWPLGWEFKRDSLSFTFPVSSPGRKYYFTYENATGNVKVSEIPLGFFSVVNELHFLNGKAPNAPFLIRTWAVYRWLALFSMAISLILGVWLWLKKNYRPWQGIVFGSIFLGTIILMISL